MQRYSASIVTVLATAFLMFSLFPGSLFADDDDDSSHDQNIFGSITVCKVIADKNGAIWNGFGQTGNFTLLATSGASVSAISLPETRFATPLTFNADVMGNDGVNDAECVTYEHLQMGSYLYGEEAIAGDGWAPPLYNDQYSSSIQTLSDFFPYDNSLFSDDSDDDNDEDQDKGDEDANDDDDDRNRNADGLVKLTKEHPLRTIVVLNRSIKDTPEISPLPITIVASKIVCDNEATLPNWGEGGPNITASTTADFMSSHQNCRFQANWSFEWGYDGVVIDPGRDFVGVAGNGWTTFGVTDQNGMASTTIMLPSNDEDEVKKIWVREVLKDGYIPFAFDRNHQNATSSESAEMYCSNDVLKYDNYDFIRDPEAGKTYYCVAWNVLKSTSATNTPPIITLLGAATTTITVGDTFTDPGATAHDAEDGTITSQIVVTGTVSTTTPGTYTLRYNVTDSGRLAAEEKTRTVVVKSQEDVCKNILLASDTSDRVEGGGNAVFTYDESPKWTAQIPGARWIWKTYLVEEPQGTTTVRFTKEFFIHGGAASSTLIVAADDYYTVWVNGHHVATEDIIVLEESDANFSHGNERTYHPSNFLAPGINTITFELTNAAYFYPGVATPYNNPAGLLYSFEIVPCATNTPPIITLLGATTTTLTVGSTFTDPGATAHDDEDGDITSKIVVTGTVTNTVAGDYTLRYNVKDSKGLPADEKTRKVSFTGGGGGGGGGDGGGGAVLFPPSLRIYNETIEKTAISGIVLVRWQTNIPADSRVVYGTTSVAVPNAASVNYGYVFGTPTLSEATTTHTMVVSGLDPQNTYYFRPISKTGSLSATGIELTLASAECYYLREFIKFGANNNPEEVKKLQIFLNSFEGAGLEVTGFYDVTTLRAVNAFQIKYKVDVLDPWGHEAPTGFVYLTTRKQVNEIYCRAAFPLNETEQREVIAFKSLLESLKRHRIVPSTATDESAIGGLVSGASTQDDSDIGGPATTTVVVVATTTTEEIPAVVEKNAIERLLGAAYDAVSNLVLSYWLILVFAFLVLVLGVLVRQFYQED